MHSAPLSPRQIADVVSMCLAEPGIKGRRDAALFALVWCGQFSVPEVVQLSVAAAQRVVAPCNAPFHQAFQQWLEIRSGAGGPFLLTINRRGRVVPEPMRATTAAEVIRRRAAEAKAGCITPQELLRAAVLASRRTVPDAPSMGSFGVLG
jgi:hypothetical protein